MRSNRAGFPPPREAVGPLPPQDHAMKDFWLLTGVRTPLLASYLAGTGCA